MIDGQTSTSSVITGLSHPLNTPDLVADFRRSTNQIGSDLAVIDAAGGEATRFVQPGDAVAPAWSPDGKLIAYAVHPLGGGSPQIYTMHPGGTNVTLRTSDYAWNGGRNPSWIPRK